MKIRIYDANSERLLIFHCAHNVAEMKETKSGISHFQTMMYLKFSIFMKNMTFRRKEVRYYCLLTYMSGEITLSISSSLAVHGTFFRLN